MKSYWVENQKTGEQDWVVCNDGYVVKKGYRVVPNTEMVAGAFVVKFYDKSKEVEVEGE